MKFYIDYNREVTREEFIKYVNEHECHAVAEASVFDGLGAVRMIRSTYIYYHNIESYAELANGERIAGEDIVDRIKISYGDGCCEYDVLEWTAYDVTHEDDEDIPEGSSVHIVEAFISVTGC